MFTLNDIRTGMLFHYIWKPYLPEIMYITYELIQDNVNYKAIMYENNRKKMFSLGDSITKEIILEFLQTGHWKIIGYKTSCMICKKDHK